MKSILNLLNKLDGLNEHLHSIKLFGDFSGDICYDNVEIESFDSKKNCISILQDMYKTQKGL